MLRRQLKAMSMAWLIACVVGVAFSQQYWGYLLFRPGIPPPANQPLAVKQLSLVTTWQAKLDPQQFISARDKWSLQDELDQYDRQSYDFPHSRLVYAWNAQGLLREPLVRVEQNDINRLVSAALPSIPKGIGEYQNTHASLVGVLAKFAAETGDYWFVGLRGGQVENDHYPYVELVFREHHGVLEMLAKQSFYLDIAGIEGCEWYVIMLMLGIPLSICFVLVVLVMGRKSPYSNFEEFWPYYLSQHQHPTCRIHHYCGTAVAITVSLMGVYLGSWWFLPAGFCSGYLFAWVGHFVFEKNRPATFLYPIWSFRADFRMMRRALTSTASKSSSASKV